jgi:anti-sigma B factor antagonist
MIALSVDVRQEGDVTVGRVEGAVDSASVDDFKKRLDTICRIPGARVVLDCRELTYLNSWAIGLLLFYNKGLVLSNGRLALCNLSERLVRTLDQLQLGEALPIFRTRDEAMEAMRG